MTKLDQKATLQIIKNLHSNDDKIVLKAIKGCKVNGNAEILKTLIYLLTDERSAVIKDAIRSLLLDLKNSSMIQVLIEAIKDPTLSEQQAFLISIFWHCPLNPNEYVSTFVNAAINGDYQVALESYTTISEITGPFPESEVNDSLLMLKDYFSQEPDDEKVPLIKEILMYIQAMERSNDLD